MRGRAGSFLQLVAREPLVHFAVLALLVSGIYWAVASQPDNREIDVSASVILGLREDYRVRNGALPSPEEEAGLIRRYVDNEILYRQARELGLDRGDIIVRRRLIQKMEYLAEQSSEFPDPTDEQLIGFWKAHADNYRSPERISFFHVFARTEPNSPDRALLRAQEFLHAIQNGANPDTLGDPFVRGRDLVDLTSADLASIFGEEFAKEVADLPPQSWSQPIPSAYGYHLVLIGSRHAEPTPSLDRIRESLRRDWSEEQRIAATKNELERLRASYSVRIATP